MRTDVRIRPSKLADADAIGKLYAEARVFMAAQHLDQWQDGYPNTESAKQDAALGVGRVLVWRDQIVATAAFLPQEPDYDVIHDGAWLQEGSYLAVHRVATAADFRGTGLASTLLEYAAEEARTAGRKSLRIDTHQMNRPMRSMLEKNGFKLCGIIILGRTGELRVGYEKVL